MQVQLILEEKAVLLRYNNVKGIDMSNKKGLKLILINGTTTIPLCQIRSLMVVEWNMPGLKI